MTAEMEYELASGFCGLLINHPDALGLLRAISVYAFWLLRIKTRRKTCTI